MRQRARRFLFLLLLPALAAGADRTSDLDDGDVAALGPRVVDGGVWFRAVLPGASEVLLAGDFTEWSPAVRLERVGAGAFEAFLPLALKGGKHRYKLVVDGVWQRDPNCRSWEYDRAGDEVSWFRVPDEIIVYRANPAALGGDWYEFTFRDRAARTVFLAGTFNNFNFHESRLERDRQGVWKGRVQLFPGKHYYCFVVDGEWKTDPTIVPTAWNRFGNRFSVLNIK